MIYTTHYLLKDKTFVSEYFKNTSMVASPQHLLDKLNYYFPAKESSHSIYRTYFWLAFAGVKQNDAIQIKSKDVNIKEHIINFDKIEYPIYEEGFSDVCFAKATHSFLTVHPDPYYISTRQRAPGDLLLRVCGKSEQIPLKSFIVKICKVINNVDAEHTLDAKFLGGLSYEKVGRSGTFYRMFEREFNGVDILPIQEIDLEYFKRSKRKEYSINGSWTEKEIKNKLSRDLIAEYQTWKRQLNIL